MMQRIRDGLKGPVIYGLLLLIIGIPFAFSGIEGYLQNNSDPVVAKVGDAKITQSQFRVAYDQRYRQLQQLLGENFRADQIDPTRLREGILKDMVQESLLRQHARSNGYRAADATVIDQLKQVPAFQDNGQFSKQRYLEALSRNGWTSERFEAQQRDGLVVEQLRDVVLGSTFVTADEAAANGRLAHQQRDFAFIKFDPAKYLPAIAVTDEEVTKRYDEKKASYQAPERIKLAYVELALEQMPKAEPPSADVLKTLYEAEKASRFTTPEVRRASHILVNFGADKAAARKKAEDLYAQVKGGADFAALARRSSDDTGSKNKGGDLGAIKRGDSVLPPKFEAALFAMAKTGDVSAPVETEFGWHVIRLDELVPARTQAFEEPEVQKGLLDLYQQAEAQKHFQEKNSKLEELAFDNAASLDAVAKTLDLKVQTTEWFTRTGGTDITANAAVIAAAFSPEVLTSNENSKPIAIDGAKIVVVRKAEYEAPRQRTLAEVDVMVRQDLKSEKAQAKAKSDADAALAALQGGQPLGAVAKTAGQTVENPGPTARDRTEIERPLLDALFKLPHPQADKASFGEATLNGGGIAVIALTAIKDSASAKSADDQHREVTSLRDARAGNEFEAYRKALEKRISVDIKPLPKDDAPAP